MSNENPIVDIIERPPWEKMPDEPIKQFNCFHLYLMQGPTRTFLAAYNHYNQMKHEGSGKVSPYKYRRAVSHSWLDWSVVYDWKARAEAWDTQNREDEEATWRQRRRAFQDRAFAMAEKMLDRAEKMLAMPLTKTQQEHNGQTIIVMPARWSFDTVPRMVAAAESISKHVEGMDLKKLLDELGEMDDEKALDTAAAIIEARKTPQ